MIFSSTKRYNICKRLWIISFCSNMGKIIGKNISNSLNSKYTPKLLDHVKQSAADAFKTSPKRVIQKTAEKKLKKHLYIIYIHGTKTKNY